MDQEGNERIQLKEYLDYFDIMLYGEEDEKMKQSFDLLDVQRKNRIQYSDFREIALSFAQMWSAALGYPMPLERNYIKGVFQQFAGGKDFFDFEDFQQQMTANPDLLLWFSKPEEAMNKKLTKNLSETTVTKKHMVEHLKTLQSKYTSYMGVVQDKLDQCR